MSFVAVFCVCVHVASEAHHCIVSYVQRREVFSAIVVVVLYEFLPFLRNMLLSFGLLLLTSFSLSFFSIGGISWLWFFLLLCLCAGSFTH